MTTDNEIKKGNVKLTVFNSFPYKELNKIIIAVCNLGYSCEVVDNGNIVFTKR